MGDTFFGDIGDSSNGKQDNRQEFQSRQQTTGDFSSIYNTTQILNDSENRNSVKVHYKDAAPSRISVKLINGVTAFCTIASFALGCWVFVTGKPTLNSAVSAWQSMGEVNVLGVVDSFLVSAGLLVDYSKSHLLLLVILAVAVVVTVITWRKRWLRKNKFPRISRRWRFIRWAFTVLNEHLPGVRVKQPFRSLIRDSSGAGTFVRAIPQAMCPECSNDNLEEWANIFKKGIGKNRRIVYKCSAGHEGEFNARSLEVEIK